MVRVYICIGRIDKRIQLKDPTNQVLKDDILNWLSIFNWTRVENKMDLL